MLKFDLNGDRVLIRPLTQEELRGSKVSIIVPSGQSKEAAQQGIVIEAGPQSIYKVGATVIFNPYAGDALRVPEGKTYTEYRIVHCDTVHASYSDQ